MKKQMICALLAVMLLVSVCGCAWKQPTAPSIFSDGNYNAGGGEVSEKVESIAIDWASGKVTLAQYSGDTIRIEETETAAMKDSQRVHWAVDGNVLRIRFEDPAAKSILNLIWNAGKELTVTVPESLQLGAITVSTASAEVCGAAAAGKVQVDTASGGVELDCITDTLKVNTASGDVSVTAGTVKEAALGTASGDVAVSAESIGTIKADTASGAVSIGLRKAPDRADIDTASGDVTLTLPEDADFTLEIDTASGRFECACPVVMQGNTYVCGNGAGKLFIETASGDIRIQKGS